MTESGAVASTVALVALVSAPMALLGTWLALPFWSWLEASTGIESVGHSGPSGWCYLAVYGLLASAGAAVALGMRRPEA